MATHHGVGVSFRSGCSTARQLAMAQSKVGLPRYPATVTPPSSGDLSTITSPAPRGCTLNRPSPGSLGRQIVSARASRAARAVPRPQCRGRSPGVPKRQGTAECNSGVLRRIAVRYLAHYAVSRVPMPGRIDHAEMRPDRTERRMGLIPASPNFAAFGSGSASFARLRFKASSRLMTLGRAAIARGVVASPFVFASTSSRGASVG